MEKRNKKKKTGVDGFIGRAFIVCTAVIMVANILYPTQKVSEEENRSLASRPEVTAGSLASGTFMEQYEKYLADQFFGRDMFRNLKVTLNRLGGSKQEAGVFIGSHDQLLDDIVVPDQQSLQDNLSSIKEFTEAYPDVPVSMILVPDKANILSGNLPNLATVADQNALISRVKKELNDSVQWIDAVKVMSSHTKENIYYKTDHHWTTLGAFYTFKEAAPILGIEEDVSSMFVSYPVTTEFNGTLAAKSGCRMNVKETIDIFVPKDIENEMVVNYVEEQKKTTSVYEADKLDTRDKYGLFFGGNSPVIDIKTVSSSKDRLLVIKDSYANCFVPFLTPFYREIVMVDPRYYSGTIQDIMSTYGITDVVFLYSGNTFFQDNSINGVLNVEQSNEAGVSAKDGAGEAE